MEKRKISSRMETNRLIIRDAIMEECDELQDIGLTWDDQACLTGDILESNYIRKCLTEGDLPPIKGACKENYHLKSISLKNENKLIGFLDLYHGYPDEDSIWISIIVIHKDMQHQGMAQEVIEAIINDATTSYYKRIAIAVHLKNWKALRFWVKTGFNKIIGIYGDKDYSVEHFAVMGLEYSFVSC